MDDDLGPMEIPYDVEECDLFVTALGIVISACQAHGAALGPDYEQAYREGIAQLIGLRGLTKDPQTDGLPFRRRSTPRVEHFVGPCPLRLQRGEPRLE